ncbi:hypothetical protein EB796_010314 [Bugula neritina]|uniref:Uncharacterized protein n=1 Tax=Bugula neritina TaxID=10212 RepID=A0A7J7JYC7_BUGNE|nr:hypothetical protein EB796_010314 [Bugula neritina]
MTSINSCQDSVNSMAQAFPEVLKHFVVESEKAVKIAKDEVQEHISKYGVESQAVVNIQNRLNSEVEAVNKECQAEMALYTNSVTSHLKDLDRTAYSIVEQAKATNQTFVDSVSAKVADITTTLTEADAASLAATNRLSDITSERANLLSAYSDVSVSSYKDATNKLDKLVGTDMKEYQSSGGTPTKTNYEHVTDITPALPRAELLATFRADSQSSKEDMAARLELPLTDSEEEEVPPVAIEQDESNTSVDDLKESSDKENIAEVVGGVSTRRRGGGIPRSNKAPSTSSAKSYPSTSGKGKNPTTSRSQASKTVKRKIPEVPDHPKKQSRNNP